MSLERTSLSHAVQIVMERGVRHLGVLSHGSLYKTDKYCRWSKTSHKPTKADFHFCLYERILIKLCSLTFARILITYPSLYIAMLQTEVSILSTKVPWRSECLDGSWSYTYWSLTEIHGVCALPCGEVHRVEMILQVGKKKWGLHSRAWKCEGDLPFHPDTVVYLEGNEVPVYRTASSEDDFACPK